jgi:uncharacterized membrane protein
MTTAPGPMRARDLLAALAVVVLWGVNFVAMKWGLRSFTPFQLGALRYLCAALPLVLLVQAPRLHWRWVLLFGAFQGVGQFGFLFVALQMGMTAALASVLLQTQVFFTALFGFGVLHERPGRPLVLGLALAGVGLLCFAMNHLQPGAATAGTTLAGLLLTLCAAASWAASNIVSRLAQQASPGYNPLSFVIWSSLVPVLPSCVAHHRHAACACRVDGITSTQSSYGVSTGSPSLSPMTVPCFSMHSSPVKGSTNRNAALRATTGWVTSSAHWRGASGRRQPGSCCASAAAEITPDCSMKRTHWSWATCRLAGSPWKPHSISSERVSPAWSSGSRSGRSRACARRLCARRPPRCARASAWPAPAPGCAAAPR